MRTLAIAFGLAALLAAAPALSARKPSLQLVRKAPLVVRGDGFRPRMIVRVLETAPVSHVVVVRTSASGSFRAALVAGDPCAAVAVHAVGRRGGRAALRVPPARLCPPARPTP